MSDIKTLVLVGGISRDSLNQKLFKSICDLQLVGFHFESYPLDRLPFFSQDLEMDPPDRVTEFKEKIREAEAILFITPEYNRSFPGVLKNAVDWGSRPYGHNLWEKKPAAILGASVGNIGTFGAQHHLRQVLSYLNVYTMGQPEFYFNSSKAFDENGKLINEKTIELLGNFFDSFKDHIEIVSQRKFSDPIKSTNEERPLAH
jgi:chromate reductase